MFEGLKDSALRKIEKNAIKIKVNDENIYLKKSGMIKDWHVIYPVVNPETRNWDLVNLLLGGKRNAFKTFIAGIFIAIFSYAIYQFLSICKIPS